MTAEPRDVEGRCGFTIIGRDGWEQPCERLATGWRWYQDCDHEDTLDVACDRHENEGGRRLAAADRENAELRGEVERLRAEASENCTGCERPTNSVDTFCFVCKLDELETTGVDLRDQLAAAQAQLAEAQEVGDLNGQEADNLLARAEAAEARLEAVRALCYRPGHRTLSPTEVLAALSAAPQPEPVPPARSSNVGGWASDAELAEVDRRTMLRAAEMEMPEPSASDEPARCEHDWDFMQPASTCRRCGAEWADTQTSPAATPPAPECRHCGGSGNAHTFDGADLGICGTCHGTGSAAGGGL